MMLHALVALWMFVVPEPAGAIHLLVESNAEVLIDGRSAGLSSDAAGGMLIDYVPAGPHDIAIITEAGGRTSFKVQVHDGELSTIQVSSLGLRALGFRRGEEAKVEVQATTDSRRCELMVGDLRIAGDKDELRLEHIAPGKQHVTVICGSHTAESDIDIPVGVTTTVTPDWETGTVRVVSNRSRVTTLEVPDHPDVPESWKAAIRSAQFSGIHTENLSRAGERRVTATFSAPDWAALVAFIHNLRESDGVEDVEVIRYVSVFSGVEVRVVITFRAAARADHLSAAR